MKSRLISGAVLTLLSVIGAHSRAQAQAGSGIVLTATSHNFVGVPQGSTVKYGIHLTNYSNAPFPFQLSLTGSPDYTQYNDCPAMIAVGAGCEIIFQYVAPQSSQWEEANFAIAPNGVAFSNGSKGFLRAHAVLPNSITVNAQKHNFGQVTVGTISPQKFGLNISNGSTTPVPFSYAPSGDTAAYTIESNCPATIAAAGQCSILFTFKPTQKSWQEMHIALSTGSVPVNGGSTVVLIGQGS